MRDSLDLGDFIMYESLGLGLLEYGDFDREELCFLGLLVDCFLFDFSLHFCCDFFYCFFGSIHENFLSLSECLLDLVNLMRVPLPLDRCESNPSS